jgi:hypothetical protein
VQIVAGVATILGFIFLTDILDVMRSEWEDAVLGKSGVYAHAKAHHTHRSYSYVMDFAAAG